MLWYNKNMKRFKRGATSFYVVAFSTLILVIIAASFATVIISELTRTSNDELSQSAYDSALAGVEDAKLAYANYLRCAGSAEQVPNGDNSVTCGEIVYWMKNPNCYMVGRILGRIGNDDTDEVPIVETTSTSGDGGVNRMNQAYTCVQMKTELNDYRANLTSDNNVRVVKVKFKNTTASQINKVRLSWYMVDGTKGFNVTNFAGNKVTFKPLGETQPSTPPTVSLQLVQTAQTFTLDQVNGIALDDSHTDRATMFFVPTSDADAARTSASVAGNYKGIFNGSINELSKEDVVKTNDQKISNVPYVVYCSDTSDFACSVLIDLPEPVSESVGGIRSDDTFMFVVTLPYGEPDTDFALEFLDGNNNRAIIDGTQVEIDSTGRANDLFRRVETRLESSDTSFPYLYYAMELLGNGTTLKKDMTVSCENNFLLNYDGNINGSNCY